MSLFFHGDYDINDDQGMIHLQFHENIILTSISNKEAC